MRRFTVIISGASGSAYGMRLIEQLLHAGEVTVLLTRTALERLAASSALSCLRPVPARPCWASWSPRLGCSARPGGAQRPRPGSVGDAQRVDAVIAAPGDAAQPHPPAQPDGAPRGGRHHCAPNAPVLRAAGERGRPGELRRWQGTGRHRRGACAVWAHRVGSGRLAARPLLDGYCVRAHNRTDGSLARCSRGR